MVNSAASPNVGGDAESHTKPKIASQSRVLSDDSSSISLPGKLGMLGKVSHMTLNCQKLV